MKKIDILVAYHKNYITFKSNYLKPIHVGASKSKIRLDFLRDDSGDNISDRNDNYCELTAVYWAWKNLDSEFIGICHYRRYFVMDNFYTNLIKLGKKIKYILKKFLSLFKNNTGYSYNLTIKYTKDQLQKEINKFDIEIDSLLDQYDLILPEKTVFLNLSVKQQYQIAHIKDDLDILEEIIREKKSNYLRNYEKIFKGNKISIYNMFIMKKDMFDEYCSWLFEILFELEKRVKISDYPYQARLFGFVSERLLNVFIDKQKENKKIKIKFLPVAFLEQ